MKELSIYYSLDADWFPKAVAGNGAKLVDDRIAIVPKSLGKGEFYFANILPGISLLLMDVVFTTEVLYKRLKSEDNMYILQYDLSDEINDVTIDDNRKDNIRLIKSSFSVMSSEVESSFKPMAGKRIFTLRLLVDANLLKEEMKKLCEDKANICTVKECLNNTCKGSKEINIDCISKNVFFYDYVDSRSRLLIHSIKEKSVFDADFDFFFKGVGLKLLSNFIEGFTTLREDTVSKIDCIAIVKAKDFLFSELYGKAPSILFLANMVGMSVSKYKMVFKEVYGVSSNKYFMREKLILAKALLQSKEFSSVGEVASLLNYSKLQYFCEKYGEFFGRKPSKDLIIKQK
jgi:AraC-like DNA-binding protein